MYQMYRLARVYKASDQIKIIFLSSYGDKMYDDTRVKIQTKDKFRDKFLLSPCWFLSSNVVFASLSGLSTKS